MDGADEGNRTPVSSLGSLRSAIEPHPRQAAFYQPHMTSPFGPMVLVADPSGARGQVGLHLPRLEDALRTMDLEYRVALVRAPGDASAVTREALEGGERFIVAVGDDRIVHEVVNGMMRGDRALVRDTVLGLVPAGASCDFSRTFGLPEDVVPAAAHLDGDGTFPIDVGMVSCRSSNGADAMTYFANIAQVGLGAAAVARAERMPKSLGGTRYFLGFWLSLARWKQAPVRLEGDRRSLEDLVRNIVVANGQFLGGGQMISPRSWPGDGFFDILVMKGPRSEAFTLLPKVFRGEHLPHPNIVELKARRLRVEGERPLWVEADGQVLGTTPALFEVIPQAISLKI
jgi:diacylglycerol kinase (ATP)